MSEPSWPTWTWTPDAASRSSAGDAFRSLPVTRWPIAASTDATALIPAPPTPTTWMRRLPDRSTGASPRRSCGTVPRTASGSRLPTGVAPTRLPGEADGKGRHRFGGVRSAESLRRRGHLREPLRIAEKSLELVGEAFRVEFVVLHDDRCADWFRAHAALAFW